MGTIPEAVLAPVWRAQRIPLPKGTSGSHSHFYQIAIECYTFRGVYLLAGRVHADACFVITSSSEIEVDLGVVLEVQAIAVNILSMGR